MKSILFGLILILFSNAVCAQQAQYQTYTAVMKIIAFKDGEQFQWENKNISVRLDYKIGDFITRLTNLDFVNADADRSQISDTILQQELEYTLKGIFPVRDIINQKQINQNYTVELLLNNDELRLREPILFNMRITRPSQGENATYRVFSLQGKLYNNLLNLPAFEGFDDEIEIWLAFNGYMNTRR